MCVASCRFGADLKVPLAVRRLAARLLDRTGSRRHRRRLLELLPQGAACAEIGVWEGDFSAKILAVVHPSKLHLVDPWEAVSSDEYAEARYGGLLERGQAEMDARHGAVLERFEEERRQGVVEVHRARSTEAVARFADAELDFVYVDGDHTYEAVRADLEAYAPKVRPNGILAGDDYGFPGWWDDGVTRAVDEFVAAGRAELVSVGGYQFVLRL